MNELKIPSTHEILRDIETNIFTSVKSKEFDHFLIDKEKKIGVCFQLSNLYRLLTAESYQSFSKDKENLDKLSQKEKQKQLKEWSKKAKQFCKKADFVHRLFFTEIFSSTQKNIIKLKISMRLSTLSYKKNY
ncbi:hypothetical protein [Streptococcus infantis]|uniref:hypothetical protein n=1 Tax=Streptococcus infantis TaxID=68892 RepID=UPI0020C8A04C|nr:hypothetical protein [Streptococcus infantis]MCP9056065.1 hypothetical protein [Streptococcus infantis]MCP9081060.1 hypothetical protein [Streptococcus infantis]